MNLSRFALVDQVRRLPAADAEALLLSLDVLEAAALADLWREFWARPDQIAPPGRWKHWLLCGGRGSGKTQTLSHWIIERARAGMGPIRLIAGTLADVRMTMVEGDSGILACSPPDFMPRWDPSADDNAGRLEWPNGVVARGFSSERPKRLRGKQSRTDAYDDLAGMGPRAPEVVAMASYGLRVWGDTRAAYTTTPEDSPVVMRLLHGEIAGLVKTESITDDNIGNLAPDFISQIEAQYGGTELEQAERFGVLVQRSRSSPFHGLEFSAAPIRIEAQPLEELEAIAIGVDPADGAGPKSDEWGIVPVGKRREDRHLVTLEDISELLPEDEAAARIIEAANRWQLACPTARVVIVVEVNHGEAKVRALLDAAYYKLRSEALEKGAPLPPPLPEIVPVRAKDGKTLRAGEVRPLFAAGMFHHLPGLVALEAQALSLRPDAPKRPRQDDRVDAEIHAAHHLAGLGGETGYAEGSRFAGVGGVPGRYHEADVRIDPGVGIGGVEGRNADPRWER